MRRDGRRRRSPLSRMQRVGRATDLRAGSLPDTQLVGGIGPYEVDVLVRVLPAGRLEILGQVTHGERVHEPVKELSVVLYDADALDAVATARTDHFGEFDLGEVPQARYALALGEARDAPCLLVWEGGSRVEARPTLV